MKSVCLDLKDREIVYEDVLRNHRLEPHEYRKRAFDPEAEFALQCIQKWGMVAAKDDGEDSSGRAKIKLSTPEEIVDRAFKIARLAMEHIAREDMLIHFPSAAEREAAIEEALSKEKD